ncbi:troponin T, skeletal muscle-like [Cylas formicarius]|uniref:troponin T, skeletal muscle-like n=1 Tax=Cylas formicarius TaxID=197179 RepID=UPI002958B4A4|nr:troponin T, skeletal muscle-like [Cylas formicarius]
MSDDEEVYSEEEEEEEVVETTTTTTSKVEEQSSGDPEFIKKQDQKRSDLDEQLREYINEWRKQRAKEEDELKRLKEKQAKRKVTRAEEERKMAERKKAEEERRLREIEEKKQKDIEEKRQRLEEAEKKRQAMMQAMNATKKGPNFTVTKRDASAANLSPSQIERNKTKEQLEEEKKIALSIRIKPLSIDGLSVDKLREKAQELWAQIVKLETEKYDLEERQKRQDYDLKELKERQKQQLRHKALKKGLDPEALTGKYPPKIQVASKYERRVDTRSYGDKKKLFEGGYEETVKETNEKIWKERSGQFETRQKTRLPKWFGERPGKKVGDPETPEGEEQQQVEEDIKQPIYEPEPEEEEEEEEVEEEEEEEDEEEEE